MLKYIIPAILAFTVGFILWIIKRDRYSLEYEVIESEIFPRDSGSGKYFVIKLRNKGNKPVENADFKVALNLGEIESVNFSNSDLIEKLSKNNDKVSCVIPLLNPSETFSITITTIKAEVYTKPEIQMRAIGVTATEKKKGDGISAYVINTLTIIAAGVAVSIIFSTLSTYKQMNTSKTIDELKVKVEESSAELKAIVEKQEKGAPQTEQIVFSIFNRNGLSNLMPELICTGSQIEYWKTGVFLVHSFLMDQKNSSKYISAMKELSETDEMAPSSKGFNLYLLGKMYHFIGNSEMAIAYFDQCKKSSPLMYEHLINQDPAYDLLELQKHLQKKRN